MGKPILNFAAYCKPARPSSARRGRHFAAGFAALLVVALAIAARQWALSRHQGINPPVSGGSGVQRVLFHRPAGTIGVGADARVGFHFSGEIPIFDQNTPPLKIPKAVAENPGRLHVTKLHFCRQDRPGRGYPRKVALWVPAPDTTVGVIHADTAQAGESATVRPSLPLVEGAYCLHLGALQDGAPVPPFTALFLIKGHENPEIKSTQVSAVGHRATLDVIVRNTGGGAFEDGRLFVTLQQRTGGRPVFKGRFEQNVGAVPGQGEKRVQVKVDNPELPSGSYYFFGWVGYPYAMDSASALQEFESETFQLGTESQK